MEPHNSVALFDSVSDGGENVAVSLYEFFYFWVDEGSEPSCECV